MSSVVIVAIPSAKDYVWKLSSEKVPHMTLLSLGDMEIGPDLARVETFLDHVVETSMCPFGASVDERGPLGPKEADVLFFRKDELKQVIDGWTNMLGDTTIRRAYLESPQFPEWTPHLTLGYPETPAKSDDREYPGIDYVYFDKIALWIGDSEGPEFKLKYDYRGGAGAVPMSHADDIIQDTLQHYGVKGMRWGQRQSSDGGGSKSTAPVTPRKVSEDATVVNKARSEIKTHGTDALSNKDLQAVVSRMNLEQQYSRLTNGSDNKNKFKTGQEKVKNVLSVVKTVQEVHNVLNSPLVKELRKQLAGPPSKKASGTKPNPKKAANA